MPLAMAKTPSELAEYLTGLGITTTTIEHAPVFTVEEAQALRGTIPGAHTKNLFLKDKKDRLFLVVAPEDSAIELKHLHALIGASGRLSFGKPDLLMETLGVTPGSVTALGAVNDTARRVTLVLDRSLAAAATINCHPLVNTATTTLATGDLLKFLRATGHEPMIVDLPRAATPEL
jgi:Ala-tRNA(Pro) deacylase